MSTSREWPPTRQTWTWTICHGDRLSSQPTLLLHQPAARHRRKFSGRLIDRFAPGQVRQAHVARAATAYLTCLLESNSHRVENDLKERTRESRRWLEGQIRMRLAGALQSAERGLAISTDKQRLSEAEVKERLARVKTLREELSTLIR